MSNTRRAQSASTPNLNEDRHEHSSGQSSANSVLFPSADDANPAAVHDSGSSSSNLTSSDKLSALPGIQSSPALGRLFNASRSGSRRSFDGTSSLPVIQSSPATHTAARLPTPASRYSESDGSAPGRETPRQRVSFDSERGSIPAALHSLKASVTGRVSQQQDTGVVSPSVRSAESSQTGSRPHIQQPSQSPRKGGVTTPISPSPSQSRAASPLRFFGWNLHRQHSRDEPFIPIDPFKAHFQFFASPSTTPQRPSLELDFHCDDTCLSCTTCLPLPTPCSSASRTKYRSCGRGLAAFFSDTLPRQLYLHILFRLPALYFSRVSRIFEGAEVSKHEIQRMIEACAPAQGDGANPGANLGMSMSAASGGFATGVRPPGQVYRPGQSVYPFPEDWNPPAVSPALSRFKHAWENFVDALIREWKTLNLVSVLLCTALLTLFQIPDAAGDPLTRWSALLSLICALMSLTYGCVYIVQFGTMRTMFKASRWAEEAQKTKTLIWWNIWVLLAMPATWLAWSMTSFCVAILSYVWRTGDSNDPPDGTRKQLSSGQALAVRTVLTVIFGLGVIYFVMIVRTFASYGERESGWRKSWLTQSQIRHAERARERDRDRDRERERGRRRARGSEHEPSRDHVEMDERHTPVNGLGLVGMSESGNLTSMAAVLSHESDLDKLEKTEQILMLEAGARGKISPKL